MNKSSKEIAIQVKDLSKSFRLPVEQASGIKQAVINRLKGIKGYKQQKVLRGISFDIQKGDFFGIVGRNGSGKSTLLKLISNIYHPDSGTVNIYGSLVSFIELGVGFNPELTGRENVYLNGALLGFSTAEVDAMYDDIVDFAELGEFMDQKLKNYSSGMQVRLAFSCAIRAKSDILVLDEVLAVGDEAFQRKCYGYFAELKKEKKTVILVTHSMDSVQQFCNKAIMIEKGEIVKNGNPAKVAQEYRRLLIEKKVVYSSGNKGGKNKHENEKVKISIRIRTHKDNNFKFIITVLPKEELPDSAITLVINRDNGEAVYRWVTDEKIGRGLLLKKGKEIKIQLQVQNIFPNGIFDIQLGVKKRDRSRDYLIVDNAAKFEVRNFVNGPFWKPNELTKITGESNE